MRKYFKHFLFSGFLIGMLYGIGALVFSYSQAPSFPGVYEAFLQIIIIFGTGLLFSIIGIVLWALLLLVGIGSEKPANSSTKSVQFKEIASNLRLDEIALMKSILNSKGIVHSVQGESFGTMRSVPSVIRLMVREDQQREAIELLKDFM